MLLKLIREYSRVETRGVLYIDDKYFGATIEPPYGTATHLKDRRYPLIGDRKGCIPEGWYRVDVTYSPKFKRMMPIIRQVPGFEGIRIHAGMNVHNTTGCICVGKRSREKELTELLIKAQERDEQIYIAIATEYSLARQLSNNDDLDWYPACTFDQ